jgi:hypothetical protein
LVFSSLETPEGMGVTGGSKCKRYAIFHLPEQLSQRKEMKASWSCNQEGQGEATILKTMHTSLRADPLRVGLDGDMACTTSPVHPGRGWARRYAHHQSCKSCATFATFANLTKPVSCINHPLKATRHPRLSAASKGGVWHLPAVFSFFHL